MAGQPGVIGHADGLGAAATFTKTSALGADGAGNLYVTDTDNNTVRKLTPPHDASTIVGTFGASGYSPGSLPAYLNAPLWGVAFFGPTLHVGINVSIMRVTNVP